MSYVIIVCPRGVINMSPTRNIKIAATFLLILLALVSNPAYAVESVDETEGASRILSLDDCLDIAIEKNIGLQRVEIGIELSALDRIRNEAFFDPGFDFDFTASGTETSDPTSFGNASDRFTIQGSYTRPAFNGSSWVFSVDQGRSTGTYSSGEESTEITSYSSQIGIAYNYPLMEGQGTRINRIGVERSDLGVIRSEVAVNETRRNLRLGVIQSYIQAVLAARQIDVLNLSLDTTENLVAEVTARINVGQLAPYELLAAQAGLAERQEGLINSESRYSTLLDNLKDIIGLPLTDEIAVDPSILKPVYIETNPDDLFIIAQRNRGDLKDLDLRIQQAQLDLLAAADRRQQSLTWSTVLGLAGEDDQYTGSISEMSDFSWYTGLQYRMELGGNRRDEADYESAKLAIEQMELDRIDFLRNIQLEIRSAHEDLRSALLRIDVTAQGLDVQELKMENEILRMEMGLITSRDLLEFDFELANARLSYDNAIADALNAVARLEYLIGEPLLDDAVMLATLYSESGGLD